MSECKLAYCALEAADGYSTDPKASVSWDFGHEHRKAAIFTLSVGGVNCAMHTDEGNLLRLGIFLVKTFGDSNE